MQGWFNIWKSIDIIEHNPCIQNIVQSYSKQNNVSGTKHTHCPMVQNTAPRNQSKERNSPKACIWLTLVVWYCTALRSQHICGYLALESVWDNSPACPASCRLEHVFPQSFGRIVSMGKQDPLLEPREGTM
jgi:hypothetical protein